MLFKNAAQLTGGTPLLQLENLRKFYGLNAKIFAKTEYFNPAGSVKDRIAKAMIEDAERRGVLKEGATIIEPTSGNMGIALAAIGGAKGYKVVLTMPETMSVERRNLIKAYGAEIVLTVGNLGMRGAIETASRLAAERNGVILGQFSNPANPAAHFSGTGPEIWNDLNGKADIFVAGVGTGGTLTGAGRFLKSKNPLVKAVAVEPADSPVLSGGVSGAHKIQGIGAGFVPEVLDREIIDEVVTVETDGAFEACRNLARVEGVLCGISSGAALIAAVRVARREENAGKNIVVILPDGGERYLSLL